MTLRDKEVHRVKKASLGIQALLVLWAEEEYLVLEGQKEA